MSIMNKFAIFLSFILFLGASNVVYSDEYDGTFVCGLVMNGDGSGDDIVVKISGTTLNTKPLGYDDSWFMDYVLIHAGKVNPFKTFVQIGNTIQESVVVVRTTTNKNILHFNAVDTSDDWEVRSRLRYAICERI